jgi:hypothetical protein
LASLIYFFPDLFHIFYRMRTIQEQNLSHWSAEISGKVLAKAEALSGPMTPTGKRVQTINAPGSEVGLETTSTWGRALTDEI